MSPDFDQTLGYLTGELDAAASDAFETALFDGSLDREDLTELSELVVGLREAAFLGILSVVASREEMARIRELGYRILEVRLTTEGEAVADLEQEFDLIFLEFEMDLTGVTQLDCEVCDHEGNAFKRNVEIPFVPDSGGLSGFCARELALAGARNNPQGMITRFLSVEPEGDRVVAEFRARSVVDRP